MAKTAFHALYERTHPDEEGALLGLITVEAETHLDAAILAQARLDEFSNRYKYSQGIKRTVIGVMNSRYTTYECPSIFTGVRPPEEPQWLIGGEVVR